MPIEQLSILYEMKNTHSFKTQLKHFLKDHVLHHQENLNKFP